MYIIKLYDKISKKTFEKVFYSEFMYKEFKRRIKYSIRLTIISDCYYKI